MYRLSDDQVDFILSDIQQKGIAMEELQQDLLDHICCIIEERLEENGDFETMYQSVVRTFYKNELVEIEQETKLLLTVKNYYQMEKGANIVGGIAVGIFVIGCLFKIQHWPGGSILIVLGGILFVFGYLPMYYLSKSKRIEAAQAKWFRLLCLLCAGLAMTGGIFQMQHWPLGKVFSFVSGTMALPLLLTWTVSTYRKRV